MKEFEVVGFEKLARNLANLRGREQYNVMRASLQAGAKAEANGLKEGARSKIQGLSKYIKYRRARATGDTFKAEVYIKKTSDKSFPFYWRFVEFGHLIVKGGTKATRQVLGHVPAYPFLRPKFESGAVRRNVLYAIAEYIKKRLIKAGGWR